jgi:hypothetical protein
MSNQKNRKAMNRFALRAGYCIVDFAMLLKKRKTVHSVIAMNMKTGAYPT